MERRARERVSRYTLLYSHAREMRTKYAHGKRMKKEERKNGKRKRMGIAGEKNKWREDLL